MGDKTVEKLHCQRSTVNCLLFAVNCLRSIEFPATPESQYTARNRIV
ncbi:MAG: hypothetical protein HC942_13980 [Microcoleus sp. SU_5_6]|nr:hypothetical protein [Microcoleus sp. SU_5_6]NJL65708.1 hypothetical protein [Microcoleus sp. SM1_3_4]